MSQNYLREELREMSRRAAELAAYLQRCEAGWDAIERGRADAEAGRVVGFDSLTAELKRGDSNGK